MAELSGELVIARARIVTGIIEAVGFKVLDNPKNLDLSNSNNASLKGR